MKRFNSVLGAFMLAVMLVFVANSSAQLRLSDTKTSTNTSINNTEVNTVLYNQIGSAGGTGSASQQFPDFTNNVIETAEDFTVPAGVNWRIDSIDCVGQWSAAGPMVTIRYNIYADSGNAGIRPGALLWADSLIVPVTALNNASPTFKLPTSRTLPGGAGGTKYWLSVMTVHPFAGTGQWFWSTRATVGQPCVLRDPGNLLAGGTAWRVTTAAPNQSVQFRLRGEVLVGPTAYTRCKSLNLLLPDNTPAGVTDTFNVVGVPAGKVIKNMYFVLDTLTSTWVGDVIMTLTKGATTVFIMNRPGSGANGSSGDNFFGTKFADTSRFSIDSILATAGATQNNPPYTGWFRCNKNINNTLAVMDSLGRFKEINPNGTWTLAASDNAAGDVNTLRNYCLIIEYGDPVGISQVSTEIPNRYFINQNYPNPFNPTTNIKFGLPNAGNVKLVVFDILGREVATLVNEFKTAGQYVVDFDASLYSSGVYFYRIESGNFTDTKRMLLVK